MRTRASVLLLPLCVEKDAGGPCFIVLSASRSHRLAVSGEGQAHSVWFSPNRSDCFSSVCSNYES